MHQRWPSQHSRMHICIKYRLQMRSGTGHPRLRLKQDIQISNDADPRAVACWHLDIGYLQIAAYSFLRTWWRLTAIEKFEICKEGWCWISQMSAGMLRFSFSPRFSSLSDFLM